MTGKTIVIEMSESAFSFIYGKSTLPNSEGFEPLLILLLQFGIVWITSGKLS